MPQATRPLFNRIALVFDFDDTLAVDSFDALLEHCGLEPQAFRKEQVDPLVEQGWENVLARFYALVQASKENDNVTITEETLLEVGRKIELFDGVTELFGRVREAAQAIVPDIEVEFYLLTAGFVEIAKGTPIAGEFKEMWGCEFHFDDGGEITFVKKILTHSEKARYLLHLSKGLSLDEGNPASAYQEVPEDEWYIPLSQVVFVGDGSSDIQAFDLMNAHQGMPLGIFLGESPDDWDSKDDMQPGRRVENLAPPDYTEEGELMRSLILATEAICKKVALRKLSVGQ